ncbi:MAG: POTRA domain-containing protein, partial [Natronospirillum sp.]
MSRIKPLIVAVCINMAAAGMVVAQAIQVEGLRRVSQAAFMSTLPGVVEGEATAEFDLGEAIRALYATGLFQDVSVYRTDAGAIQFDVAEYATIDRVTLTGNSRIPTEGIENALDDLGVVEGQSYQPAILSVIQTELESQYAIQGRYNARVDVSVDPLPQNRVAVIIDIEEGSAAAIRSIELRGNEVFDDAELLQDTRLRPRRTGDPLQLIGRRYEYNRDVFAGDLESINSYYFDRGYVRFSIDNNQVSLEPDLSGVHLLTEVSEGERYRWGAVRLSGQFVGFEEELRAAIEPTEGEWFNRSEL